MVGFAWSRVQSTLPIAIGRVIDDILLVAVCYTVEEIKDQVLFIPL